MSSRASAVVTTALLFLAVWLVVDGVAGERGWLANRRGRAELSRQRQLLESARAENAQRQELIRRLEAGDPATIEAYARLRGFIHPGEKMFIVRDAKPAR